MDLFETAPEDRGTVLAEKRTELAIQRTNMAAERSLMAWVRTSLSMIGFGFSIYKFFQYLPEELATGNIRRPQAPRNLGRGSNFCHLDWIDHVLWRSVAPRTVLVGCIHRR